MIQDVATHYGWSLEAFQNLPFSERRLLIAAYECDVLKVQEQPRGTNRGARVETYLKSVGLGGGYAWCAAFVTWCSKQSDPSHKVAPNPAMAASWLKFQPKSRKEVKRGDLGGFINADGTGHVYLITFVEYNAKKEAVRVHTIEGNSNDEGIREGFEVCRRVRVWTDKMRFAA